ncbi:FAD:protein FMN transferase [Sphingobacterium deserti]|uniref:FAD:protein FMN transferase n=1 Tax=Sphingobacterium deserti TaxID=1229276 RepID=A0A0B8T255_9SPHI|nr:FAD:protein FMN transferase [Sphingobacterium deserti]KGE12858.1 ApbE family lipoprotein [Sphingobacterium deserti]
MSKPINVILAVFIVHFCLSVDAFAQVTLTRKATLMGSKFEFALVEKDSTLANKRLDEVINEVQRIENLISEWQPHTQISEVNRYAGVQPVKVDREVFDLTVRALYFSRITDGAFDISIAALDKIWRFDDSMERLPTQEAIQKSVEKVGFQDIILDSNACTIFLAREGMKIGFGSIGKGYAADRCRSILIKSGVTSGLINASGDIATWGNQLGGDPWLIGLRNPFNQHKMIRLLKLRESAVATSGSYEKYVEFEGKRYAHIINPKTGYPSTGLVSVTIYGPSAEFANGLSTSIMVMGLKAGIKLLHKYPAYKGIFVTDRGKVVRR